MTAKCWVRLNGDEPEPVSAVELRVMAHDGRLSPNTPVSLDGIKWTPAARVRGLFVALGPLPPPLPSSSAIARPAAPEREPEFQIDAETILPLDAERGDSPARRRPHWSTGRSRLAPLGIAAVAGCLLGILCMSAVWILAPRPKSRAVGSLAGLDEKSKPTQRRSIDAAVAEPGMPDAAMPDVAMVPLDAAAANKTSPDISLRKNDRPAGKSTSGKSATHNPTTDKPTAGKPQPSNLTRASASSAVASTMDIGPPDVAQAVGVAKNRPPQAAPSNAASSSVIVVPPLTIKDAPAAGAKNGNIADGLAMANQPPAIAGMAPAPPGRPGGVFPGGAVPGGAAPGGAVPGLMNRGPGPAQLGLGGAGGVGGMAAQNRPPLMPAGLPPDANNERMRRRLLVLGQGGTAESELAVEAALVWLAEHQLADGGWSFDQTASCGGLCPDSGMFIDARIGATAMALLPFLAAGYTYEEGPYQRQVAGGLNFLMHEQKADGSLYESSGTFYSHGIAALALCDAYNMVAPIPADGKHGPGGTENPLNIIQPPTSAQQRALKAEQAKALKAEQAKAAKAAKAALAQSRKRPGANKEPNAALIFVPEAPPVPFNPAKPLQAAALGIAAQKSLDFIVASQSPFNGGWRYDPGAPGDTSVVGWQSMALKAGLLARLHVPPATIVGVSGFLDSVQSNYGAAYGYLNAGRGTPATTAIGLLLRMQMGWDHKHPALAAGAMTLVAIGPSPDDMYYNMYASQVLRNYGGPGYEKWNPIIRDFLIQRQMKLPHVRGSWHFESKHSPAGGRLYNTVLSTLILEMYYRYEPIYPVYPPLPPAPPGSVGEAASKELAERQKAAAARP